MSVGDVGGGRLIVGRNVGAWGDGGFTGRRRGVIGRLRRERKLIGRGRTAVVMVGAKGMKKRWMIHLQKGYPWEL
jgi:hypothetical protein